MIDSKGAAVQILKVTDWDYDQFSEEPRALVGITVW